VGRVDEGKPGDEFVQAIARLARDREVVGLVVGGGPGVVRLERLATELHAPVEFLGEQDPEPLLRRAWALGLFSRHEAVSFVAQEAMWMGRPVVVSPLPGLEWLVGDTGLFAADVDEAVAGMASLCDPERAGRLGERAAERIRRLIAPDDPWPAIAMMYEEQLRRA
jgi:glycosyltransferase involved in cell wall biosynthesis